MPTKNTQQPAYTAMPNSIEAEQSVLCCILRNGENQAEIVANLHADDFYQPAHATIFEAMSDIANRVVAMGETTSVNSINFTTLVDYLRRNGKLAQVGDIDYILKLNELLPGTSNYDEYVSIVKRASTMRKLIDICGKVTQKAYSSSTAEEAITYAEEAIFALTQRGANGGLVDLSTDIALTLKRINDRFVDPAKFRGIQTGFRRFDRMTNGLHGGELIVLAARPGVGKSAMAMNIVENVAKNGGTVAVFSLEMSNEQLIERMLSSMSTVPLEFIKSGQLPNGEGDLAKLYTAQETMSSSMRLFGNDYANIKPSEMASQCRRLKAKSGLDLVVIDYIQLMNSGTDPKQGRQNEVASITRALKLMAKELDVPVIALSQLKRDAAIRSAASGKEGGGEPVLSDLRESGAIEQDADIVLFIHKVEDKENNTVEHSLIVAKHRNGETGTIPLKWIGRIVRFVDEDFLRENDIDAGDTSGPSPSDYEGDMQFGEEGQDEFVTDLYDVDETISDDDIPSEGDN